MNKSNIFKLAHSLTKQSIKAGDSYQVNFGAALKYILKASKYFKKIVAPIVAQGIVKMTADTRAKGYHLIVNTKISSYDLTAFFNKKSKSTRYFFSHDAKAKSIDAHILLGTIYNLKA